MQGTIPRIGRGFVGSDDGRSAARRLFDALIRHRMLIGIIIVIGAKLLNSVATGFDLSMRLAYLLMILLIISWIWSRVGSANMKASVNRPTGPFSVGDTLSERIVIQNSNGAPKAWVEVEDKTTLPDVEFREVTSFGLMVTFKRVDMEAALTQRGEYDLGPLVIRASDPFNLFPRDIEFEGVDKVLVYPRVLPMPDLAASRVLLADGHSRRQRMNVLSTDVASVRQYADGDPIGRIHWLTTARTGELMVKQFDQGSAGEMWVLFDQNVDAQAGEGKDSTDEYGATIAASIVDKYTRNFTEVGYVAYGSNSLIATPEHTASHRENILRHIAASRPTGDVPIIQALATLDRDLFVSSTAVVITAANDGDWIDALGTLQRRGVQVICIVLDRESFGGESNASVIPRLSMSGVTTYRVYQGDDIADALSTTADADAAAARISALYSGSDDSSESETDVPDTQSNESEPSASDPSFSPPVQQA